MYILFIPLQRRKDKTTINNNSINNLNLKHHETG